ncbi:hypothetical protein ABFT23_11735 [Nocardioides sp. C4-1]|uniref:hypothetical protein n=1 Tax=Nocardioides sp. C4-1 TaxID=3151851 RepID=UPI003264F87C
MATESAHCTNVDVSEDQVQQREFDSLDQMVDLIARHTARALLSLEGLRRSPDGAERDAYRQVHALLGDLASMKVRLGLMDPSRDAPSPERSTTPPIATVAE